MTPMSQSKELFGISESPSNISESVWTVTEWLSGSPIKPQIVTTQNKLRIITESEMKWRVAKYGDPYSEFVLCI